MYLIIEPGVRKGVGREAFYLKGLRITNFDFTMNTDTWRCKYCLTAGVEKLSSFIRFMFYL